jgi:anti-sigma factor RsiW
MRCEELLKALSEYVDGELDPAICKGFEEHLAGCNPCQVVFDNVRNTISLYQAGQPYAIPKEFGARLNDALGKAWKAKFPESK